METMNRRTFLRTTAIIAAVAASGMTAQAAEARRPNILVLLTDDVGWGDPTCYNPKSKIPTPNIDKLAADGMRFTHAHTPAALCSPTRYSMLSGNYSWRGRAAAGVWGFNVPSAFKHGQKSVGRMLQAAGYRTAMFGKAGIGGFYARSKKEKPSKTLAPVAWGFDYSWIVPKGHQAPPLAFFENGVAATDIRNNRAPEWSHSKVGASLLEKAAGFLDDHLANHKDKPFYMHFCSDGAHGPYDPAARLAGQPLAGATKMTAHTDMVYETDILLGALVKALEKRGLRDNTLVIYVSDNGGLPFERDHGHDAVAGLRGLKSTIFEGGQRVPFVASWPGRIPKGTVRNQLIGAHDTVATALELAGVTVPKGQARDSISLVPVLLGKRDDKNPVRKTLLVQSSPGRGAFVDKGYRAGKPGPKTPEKTKGSKRKGGRQMAFALFAGNWKLVLQNGKPEALYDLTVDLAEENNLIADSTHASRVKQMTMQYQKIRTGK